MQKLKVIVGAALVVVGVALLTGCEKSAEEIVVAGADRDFKVARLFTVDGCTAYRFYDSGRKIYYTNCKGQSTWETGSKSKTQHQVNTFAE